MTSVHRRPAEPLRGLVRSVWAHEPTLPAGPRVGSCEHVLPTGATHIVLRIGGPSILVFDHAADRLGHRLGHAVVGGARTTYHVRDVSMPSVSVGAVLRPAATGILLGVPESALAGHHTPLECLLPAVEVDRLLSRLHRCTDSPARALVFERWLSGRAMGRSPVLHPALSSVLARPSHLREGRQVREGIVDAEWFSWNEEGGVGAMVRASGLSHRHWIALFRQATGLTPRDWLGMRRFSRALDLATDFSLGWAEIAAASGFTDQAHLANTFRTVTGFTPVAWRRRVDPASPRHVRR